MPSWKAEGRAWAEISQASFALAPTQPSRACARVYHAKDGAILIQRGGKPSQKRLIAFFRVDDPWVEARSYASPEIAKSENERVVREIGAKLGAVTVAYWLAAFEREGIPPSEVHHPLEMLQHS